MAYIRNCKNADGIPRYTDMAPIFRSRSELEWIAGSCPGVRGISEPAWQAAVRPCSYRTAFEEELDRIAHHGYPY